MKALSAADLARLRRQFAQARAEDFRVPHRQLWRPRGPKRPGATTATAKWSMSTAHLR